MDRENLLATIRMFNRRIREVKNALVRIYFRMREIVAHIRRDRYQRENDQNQFTQHPLTWHSVIRMHVYAMQQLCELQIYCEMLAVLIHNIEDVNDFIISEDESDE